jgi:hypothetical protein
VYVLEGLNVSEGSCRIAVYTTLKIFVITKANEMHNFSVRSKVPDDERHNARNMLNY